MGSGHAAPDAVSGTPACPFCEATATELVGQWGGQIITAQWRCRACGSYFEAVREAFADASGPFDSDLPDPARITLRRRIDWMDTDAGGTSHWTTAFRLAEVAEAALHTALRIVDRTFGVTPRVAVDATFQRGLRFNEVAEVALSVARIGRTSVSYDVAISGPEGIVAEGQITTCLIDRETGRPAAWPDDMRALLTSAGKQTAGLEIGV
jgi:acyl-CoA thioester hydrolase